MKIRINEAGVTGIVVGVAGLIYGIWRERKANELAKKLDVSLKDLENRTPVDIREDVVNKAITNAVEHQVKESVKKAAEEVVKEAVQEELNSIRDKLEAETETLFKKELDDLNFDEIRDRVQRKLEKKAFEKLCDMYGIGGKIFNGASKIISGDYSGVSSFANAFDNDWYRLEAIKALVGKR